MSKAIPRKTTSSTKTRVAIASAGLAALVGVILPATAAHALNTWAQATQVTAPTNAATVASPSLAGISCSSVGNCTAVGQYTDSSSNFQAMVATETSGVWAQATEVTAPTGAATNPGAAFSAISCSSVGNCTAAGGYNDSSSNNLAMVATETSGTWAQATEVSAPSNGASNPLFFVTGISCSSPGNCTLVGHYTDTSDTQQAVAATETSGTWAQATEVAAPADASSGNPGNFLDGVSCSAAGSCTASGTYRDTSGNFQAWSATETSATWGAQGTKVTAPADARTNPGAELFGISCSSAGNCTAAGAYTTTTGAGQAMAATETSGTWAQGTVVTAPANALSTNPGSSLQGISCSSAGNCTASGFYTDSSSNGQAMAATETSGTWAQETEVTAPGNAGTNPQGALFAVSCSSAGNCTAAGDYHDSSGHQQAMVATETGTRGPVLGYWTDAADGGIFSFGQAQFHGSMGGIPLNKPVVGMAPTADGGGYWMDASDGGVFAFGNAQFYGSMGGKPLNKPVVGMAPTPDGGGYWLVASDGGIFNFGDAKFHGSTGSLVLNKPIVGMAVTPDGLGYWLVASDGGVFAFGSAQFFGSMGGKALNQPMVGIAPTGDGAGYWTDASDGGIFAFGDAHFFGSMGGKPLNKPMVGMASTPDGGGYWMDASDGGIFTFGNATFFGSMGGKPLNAPMVGMATFS